MGTLATQVIAFEAAFSLRRWVPPLLKAFIAGLLSMFCIQCQHAPTWLAAGKEPITADHRPLLSFSQWQSQVLSIGSDSDRFDRPGPFRFRRYHDFDVSLSPLSAVDTDLYLSEHSDLAPLVIISHGNGYSKLAHRAQARRLASWGFHCLLLELPNRDHWLRNGRTIDALVRLVHAYPHLLGPNIDPEQIILVGHSFGGSAVTLAASRQTPAKAMILLDPAVVHESISRAMSEVTLPVVILGADPQVFAAKKRSQFFSKLAGPVAEISIKGATHTDAQRPSIYEVFWGFDFVGDRKKQKLFVAEMLASLFSLTANDRFTFAAQVFARDSARGLLKDVRLRLPAAAVPARPAVEQRLSVRPSARGS